MILSCKCGKFIIGLLHRNGAFFIPMMRIVQIDDYFIEDLVKQFPHVMFSKRFHRRHTRKYVGVVFSINDQNYYVPFSSPKDNDYTQDHLIKSDNLFCARMVEDDGVGKKRLLGTLRFNNMIPIPMIFVEGYQIQSEEDNKYIDLLDAEWKWINKNQDYIREKAKKIYAFKNSESERRDEFNGRRYDAILPFKEIEEYIKSKY